MILRKFSLLATKIKLIRQHTFQIEEKEYPEFCRDVNIVTIHLFSNIERKIVDVSSTFY